MRSAAPVAFVLALSVLPLRVIAQAAPEAPAPPPAVTSAPPPQADAPPPVQSETPPQTYQQSATSEAPPPQSAAPSPPPPAYASPPPAYVAPQAEYLPPPPPPEPKSRDIVIAYNRGLRFGISPGIMISPSSGDVGFSIAGDVRYGFALGDAVVLAPGLRLGGYFPPDQTIVIGLGTLRLTVPVGPVGPFVVGGVGPGWVKEPSEVGAAWLAGGGFVVHIGTSFGIGAEVGYQAIAKTDFGALFFGPLFLLSF